MAQRKSAFARIVQLSRVRDRSSFELRARLAQDGYGAQEAADAVGRAVDCGLVDDARFADAFVRGRASAGRGAMQIERELQQRHGIEASSLPGWPQAYGMGEQAQLVRAMERLRAHPPRARNQRDGAFRALVGRGYSPDIAAKAAQAWMDAH